MGWWVAPVYVQGTYDHLKLAIEADSKEDMTVQLASMMAAHSATIGKVLVADEPPFEIKPCTGC